MSPKAKRTTMAKMQREQKVRERRMLKQGKKDAAAAARSGEAESGPETPAAPDEAASGPSS